MTGLVENFEGANATRVRGSVVAVETRTVLKALWRDGASPSPGGDRPIRPGEVVRQLLVTGRELRVQIQRIPSGWWIATVDGVERFFVRGRSLREVRVRLRAELKEIAGEDVAARTPWREHVVLPERVRWQLREAEAMKGRVHRARREAEEAVREAAVRLRREAGLYLRDAGDLLGISAQQVRRIAVDGKGSYR